jgi:hypothetical protein
MDLLKIPAKDFFILETRIEMEPVETGRVSFFLDPHSEAGKEWTIGKLDKIKEEFYKDIQRVMMGTGFDFVILSTQGHKNHVTGYSISAGYNI